VINNQTDSVCNDDNAVFYIQYSCIQSGAVLETKYKQGTIISCLGIFASLFFMVVIYWLKRASKIKQLEWDVSTVTASDYSVEMEITEEQYTWFLENVYNPTDRHAGLSPGESLKKYLKQEVEGLLTNYLREKRANGDLETSTKITEVKIADIVFAFNNAELIQLLRVRG
jgi:hypothetical protein